MGIICILPSLGLGIESQHVRSRCNKVCMSGRCRSEQRALSFTCLFVFFVCAFDSSAVSKVVSQLVHVDFCVQPLNALAVPGNENLHRNHDQHGVERKAP